VPTKTGIRIDNKSLHDDCVQHMSDIDLIQHYRLGLFLGKIAVYQCLEDVCWIGRKDKTQPSGVVEKNDICIGGGSGEHPAIVIKKMESCVARYLQYTGCRRENIKRHVSVKLNAFIIFCEWKKHDHDAFYEFCYDSYRFFKKQMRFDGWIAASVGEFIFHVIPSYSLQSLDQTMAR
jgi:hypothetical protein